MNTASRCHHSTPQRRKASGVLYNTLNACMQTVNQLLLQCSMAAVLLAAMALTYGMSARYFFAISTEWQDEVAVFLLVSATFASCAWVQARRGHIGIEAVAAYLGPRANRWRLTLADAMSSAFCSFFAWQAWRLFFEAWQSGQTTTSSWGPPLAIPYLAMSSGMSLLALQVLLQLFSRLSFPSTSPDIEKKVP